MFTVTRSKERFHDEMDWLSTYWHFSFGHYYDPKNVHFGLLRVFNHDWIKPDSGFPMHPHQDMEIITYVLNGELRHEDDAGHRGLLRAGDVQHMTAGTGVVHSEANPSKHETLELLQMWILPSKKGRRPAYQDKHFTVEDRRGRLFPAVSGQGHAEALEFPEDVMFYISRLDKGQGVSHPLKDRRAYLYVIEGELRSNDNLLNAGDSARIDGEPVSFKAAQDSEMILIDLP